MTNIKFMPLLLVLFLCPYGYAQKITINLHKVALVEVLYELAAAAQINLVLTHTLDTEISLLLTDVEAKTGLDLVCSSVAVECQYTSLGLVVGVATDQTKTPVLPLHKIKLNYSDASVVLAALQGVQSMLSPGGQMLADSRSQQIFIYDDNAHAASLIEAIQQLDQPLKQMLIEGRIVIAKSSLDQSSGLTFVGGLSSQAASAIDKGGQLGVNFNHLGAGLRLGLVGAHVMLNLELAALEATGQVLTLAQPQILVQEGYAGRIQTGQEVPYLVATDNGQQQEWKRAVLGLTVTPRVLPKNQVQLDLEVVQDSIGDLLPNGQLALNTHQLQTRAVVGLGQTLVLGGALYQQQLDRLLTSPALSGLPFLGQWFEQQKRGAQRLELLVFVTPRIVNP